MCDGTPWRPPTCSTHCARGTEGAARSCGAWVPTQAAAVASPALLTLTQTILPFLASPAGSWLASGRPCRRRRQPGAGRYPNYRPGVDGISFTVHPLGSRWPFDPQRTVRMHPIRTPAKPTGLPPGRVVVPRCCLAGLRRAASRCGFDPA